MTGVEGTGVEAKAQELPSNIGSLQTPVGWIMKPLFRRLWNLEVTGLQHIPAAGGAVMCPNHLSVIDSFMLPAVLPRSIMYVGKAEYLDDWKTARLFPALGMIPIDRRGGDHASAALDVARQVLQRGGLFGIYPEGTRSRSGRLHKGHTGAARLAIETNSPIIPVGLIGMLDIQPPDQAVPNFFRSAQIKIGRPIDVGRYQRRVGDRAVYRELTDEVMYEIGQLSGQTYDDTYAGSADAASTDAASTDAVERQIADGHESAIPRRSSVEVLRPRPLLSV